MPLFRRLLVMAVVSLILCGSSAQAGLPSRLQRKADESAKVLQELATGQDTRIPQGILSQAECLVVMPQATKELCFWADVSAKEWRPVA